MTEQVTEFQWVALVPMRHHSERVPGKNYRPMAGKPLYGYIIETLTSVEEIERIVVDTDSPVIWEGISEQYPQVRLIKRPDHLTAGDIPMNRVLAHDLQQVQSQFYLQTHSTNPMLKADTISAAIQEFEDKFPAVDSLFGVTKLQTRLWSSDGEPINHNPTELLRTQDLPPVYEENSCFYLFERDNFLARGHRIGEQPAMFPVEAAQAYDIDNELNFRVVDCLVRTQLKSNQNLD